MSDVLSALAQVSPETWSALGVGIGTALAGILVALRGRAHGAVNDDAHDSASPGESGLRALLHRIEVDVAVIRSIVEKRQDR